MSDEKFAMPTLITGSLILNSIIRGATKAAEELGEGYFSVVRQESYKSTVAVFRPSRKEEPEDVLKVSQPIDLGRPPLWAMTLEDRQLDYEKAQNPLFKDNPPRYFFLSDGEALNYLKSIEVATANLIVNRTKTAEENADD